MKQGKSLSSRSLKFKLILLSMGITAVLGVSATVIVTNLANTAESNRLSSFEGHAHGLADAVAAQFYERYGDVQAFAINPALQSRTRSTIVETLNVYSAMYGIYDLIMVVDAHGTLVAVNSKSPEGKDISSQSLYSKSYADEPWFKAALAGQTTDDKDKGFTGTFVEDVQLDPWASLVFGGNRLGSGFSAPIKDAAGKTIGVITNRAGSRWFEVAFKELAAGLKRMGYPHAQSEFFNREGVLMFQYSSESASDKLDEPKYDFGVLLKLNMASKGDQIVKNLISGKSGSAYEPDLKTGDVEIAGYAPVDSAKFINKLGWSVAVRDSKAEVMVDLARAKMLFHTAFFLVMALSCLVSYTFSTSLSKRLTELASRLSVGSSEVSQASNSISSSSTELSEAAVEQAAAIQQTAASVDQVSAMVKKSAENATQSQGASQTSRSTAEKGQEAVQEMIGAIGDISRSNTDIMNQVEDGNRQIAEIVKVISEIESKTKVINDIVFQTKLLSFNASVEAARAGEQGKGFAVVAEEVGNLAQMSGNAAKEISAMLESSIQKVEGIVSDTKTKVERLVVESRVKVEAGTRVAEKCGEALSHILTSVQEVDGMVAEITSASNEQAQGVTEINKAMNQLDQVTQRNTSVAQQAATSAEQLSAQAGQLNQMLQDLFGLINGGTGQAQTERIEPSNGVRRPSVSSAAAKVIQIKKSAPMAPKARAVASSARVGNSSAAPAHDDPRFEDI